MDGVSVTTSNYAKWLSRLRGDVCVVTPNAPEADDSKTGYPVLRYFSLPIPMRRPYRYGMPQADLMFQHRIGQTPFSLVHAHCPFSSGELALGIASSRHIPLVATFHSKYRTDFERVFRNKYVVDYLIQKIVSFYNQADEVWIPQESVGETLLEYGYKGRMEVVDNGNDFASTPYSPELKAEARRSLRINADMPMLLFVGQHIWEKNVGLILQSLARLRHVSFSMVFVGTGYAAEMMRRMADDLGLTVPDGNGHVRVRFDGPVYDRETMRRYYLAADLFLFPSLYDNAPLVVREAAAMHTPAVMAEGSTAASVVADGQNGFLSKPDVESFAHKIESLLSSPLAIERAGAGAAHTLARSWEDIAGEVSDRYDHLIRRYETKVV